MTTLEEIKELKEELDDLENEYLQQTPPCNNLECPFYRNKGGGQCSWTILIEDCKDYIPT